MAKNSPRYDPSIRDELDKADWDSVFPAVLKYARWRAKKFQWLGDQVDPENLVHEAIARAYGGGTNGNYRNWNKDKYPKLEDFLISIIDSITSHKAGSAKKFPTEPIFNEDGTPKDKKVIKSAETSDKITIPRSPEEQVLEYEKIKPLLDELESIANEEDDDLGMVILCIQDGIGRQRHIVEETGFDKKKVNNLLRKLRNRLKNFKPKSESLFAIER